MFHIVMAMSNQRAVVRRLRTSTARCDAMTRDFCIQFPEYCVSAHKVTEPNATRLNFMSLAPAQFIAGLSSRWRSLFSRSKKLSSRPEHVRGAKGEDAACRFLRKNGYKVLYRNFKHRPGGEIDIVCRDDETLVFVEVKTRANEDLRRPLEDIKEFQKRQISRGALVWLRMLDNPEVSFRFDVVEVITGTEGKPRCELIQNAFELTGARMY
jgi:putative endonuclease